MMKYLHFMYMYIEQNSNEINSPFATFFNILRINWALYFNFVWNNLYMSTNRKQWKESVNFKFCFIALLIIRWVHGRLESRKTTGVMIIIISLNYQAAYFPHRHIFQYICTARKWWLIFQTGLLSKPAFFRDFRVLL